MAVWLGDAVHVGPRLLEGVHGCHVMRSKQTCGPVGLGTRPPRLWCCRCVAMGPFRHLENGVHPLPLLHHYTGQTFEC